MRIVVIGGTGHIGTYLSPLLATAGHEVICISRGRSRPYQEHPAWSKIDHQTLDRQVEEQNGTFGNRIAELNAEVVIDLTCYRLESAQQLAAALRGRVQHFLHCGTIWVYGHSIEVPTTEDAQREPFGDYGCRKLAIEQYLLQEAAAGFPATIVHPGHLAGPGWAPINPAGNFNTQVFSDLACGREVALPHMGMETLHHVHASDVAGVFAAAVDARAAAIGESFHAVSPSALTLRGYAEHVAGWFRREARLRFLPWEQWQATVSEADARITLDHLRHSPNCSMDKARRLLGFTPRIRSLDAIQEAVRWLISNGRIAISENQSTTM